MIVPISVLCLPTVLKCKLGLQLKLMTDKFTSDTHLQSNLYWLLQRILLHSRNMGQRNGSISCVDEQTTKLVSSDSLQESDVVLPRGKQALCFVTLRLPLIKCNSWPLFVPQLQMATILATFLHDRHISSFQSH